MTLLRTNNSAITMNLRTEDSFLYVSENNFHHFVNDTITIEAMSFGQRVSSRRIRFNAERLNNIVEEVQRAVNEMTSLISRYEERSSL